MFALGRHRKHVQTNAALKGRQDSELDKSI